MVAIKAYQLSVVYVMTLAKWQMTIPFPEKPQTIASLSFLLVGILQRMCTTRYAAHTKDTMRPTLVSQLSSRSVLQLVHFPRITEYRKK